VKTGVGLGVVVVEVEAKDDQEYFLVVQSPLVQDLALLTLKAVDYFPLSCHHVLRYQHALYWVSLQDPVPVGYSRSVNDHARQDLDYLRQRS